MFMKLCKRIAVVTKFGKGPVIQKIIKCTKKGKKEVKEVVSDAKYKSYEDL